MVDYVENSKFTKCKCFNSKLLLAAVCVQTDGDRRITVKIKLYVTELFI